MATETINAQVILDRLNLTESEITKAKTEPLIDDAITTVENELDVTIGELSGEAGSKSITVDKKYAPVIKDLSAIYLLCTVSGGSATGLTFEVGELKADVLNRAPQLTILEKRVEAALEVLKVIDADVDFRVLSD